MKTYNAEFKQTTLLVFHSFSNDRKGSTYCHHKQLTRKVPEAEVPVWPAVFFAFWCITSFQAVCLLICLVLGILVHTHKVRTASSSQEKGKSCYRVVVADQKKTHSPHFSFLYFYFCINKCKTTFVKAVVDHTVVGGEEGQTLIPTDICHSFNTVKWTSLPLASTTELSLLAREHWKGPALQLLCTGTSRRIQDWRLWPYAFYNG